MIFDKICGYIEKYKKLNTLRPLVESSKLFDFPLKAHEIPQTLTAESFQEFFLPFPTVAIEDKASLIILSDVEPGQIGMNSPRLFIEVMPLVIDTGAFAHGPEFEPDFDPMVNLANNGIEAIIIVGYISSHKVRDEGGVEIQGGTRSMFYINIDGEINEVPPPSDANMTLRNPIAAVEEIIYFNTHNRFILESKLKNPPKRKNKKIIRSHERPKYTILEVGKIRSKLGLEQVDPLKVLEHGFDRRAHWRYFQDKKYSENNTLSLKPLPDGRMYYKKTRVGSTWVGPTKAIVGKRIYTVRTDL